MDNNIAYHSICVRQVLDNPCNTFKFTRNKIEKRIFAFKPPYKGFSAFSMRGTSSTYPLMLSFIGEA